MSDKVLKHRPKRAIRAPQGAKLWMEKSMQPELSEPSPQDPEERSKAA